MFECVLRGGRNESAAGLVPSSPNEWNLEVTGLAGRLDSGDTDCWPSMSGSGVGR